MNRYVCIGLVFCLLLGAQSDKNAFAASGIDTAGGNLPFNIQGNQVMNLTQAGLAIGTASPVAALTVNGNIAVLGIASANSACSSLGLLAQDGTGKILSCQKSNGGSAMTWAQAMGGGIQKAVCGYNGVNAYAVRSGTSIILTTISCSGGSYIGANPTTPSVTGETSASCAQVEGESGGYESSVAVYGSYTASANDTGLTLRGGLYTSNQVQCTAVWQ